MKQVKFFDTGKWAEHKPYMDQVDVKAGDVKDVSDELAKSAVDAGKAEYVDAEKPKELTESEALEIAKGMGNKSKGKKNRK